MFSSNTTDTPPVQSYSTGAPPRRHRHSTAGPVRGHKRVLIIFGMQQDFFETLVISNPRASLIHKQGAMANHRPGALPVPGATKVASTLRQLLKLDFDAVIWCKTCHPINHCSFVENNPGSVIGTFEFMLLRNLEYQAWQRTMKSNRSFTLGQMDSSVSNSNAGDEGNTLKRNSYTLGQKKRLQQLIRPTHCVEGTKGADFHPDLRPSPRDKVLKSSTSPISQSPAVPENLLSTLKNISSLGEIYFAGIGVSPFVDTVASQLFRIMPSIHIYGLVDICRVLNIGDGGLVVETDIETLDTMFHRAKIRAMHSENLIKGMRYRLLEGLSNLHWDDFVQALSAHLSQTNKTINHNVLLELLHNRELHMHNSMPAQDWLERAGFWDHDIIDRIHEVSGENLLHAAARLGDIVFVQEMLGGKHTNTPGKDHNKHIVPAKFKLDIISAENLPKSDLLGLSDPYAVIRIGPSDVPFEKKTVVLTTPVQYKTLNPEWNSRFEISTDELSTTESVLELDIKIYDKDQISKDDLLGEVCIPITRRNCTEESYPLDNCKTEAFVGLRWQTMYTSNSLARQHDSHAEILMNSLTTDGNSPLTLAVAHGHGAVASLLVRSGLATYNHINHRVASDRGLTPLMYACLNGDRETIKLLLAFGAEPRAVSLTGTPTLLFCTFGQDQNHLDSFVTLIKSVPAHSRHVMLNQTDQCGWSCLHTMSRTSASGHVRWNVILPKTLKKVAINALTLDGLSILHLASWNLSLNTLRLLLEVHKLADYGKNIKDKTKKKVEKKVDKTQKRINENNTSKENDMKKREAAQIFDAGMSLGEELTKALEQERKAVENSLKLAKMNKPNRFEVFVAKELKTMGTKHHTAMDLSILRYLHGNNTGLYSRAFECITILAAANFTASSTVGSACQRVFDRILIAGDTSAVAGMLRSDNNAINIRKHHVTLASGDSNYKFNTCTFSIGSMDGRDQHMYYDRISRTQVCQVCRDLCFEEKATEWAKHQNDSSGDFNKPNNSRNSSKFKQHKNQGLTYLGFLEGGICECQQNSVDGHRCRAVDRTDEKALAIKLYVPTSVLVPADIRHRTIVALDGLIRELAYSLHAREKMNKEQQGWTFGNRLSEDLQTDPKLAPFNKLSLEDSLSFREEIITLVSLINYAGFNIIGPITNLDKVSILPPELNPLSKFIGHNAHERWAEDKVRKGWHYAPVWLMNAKNNGKLDSRLVPFKFLSEYHRNKWIHAGVEKMIDILNCGYRIIVIDKMKLPQLVENLANTELAGLPTNSLVPKEIPQPQKLTKKSSSNVRISENRQISNTLMNTLLLAASRWSLLSIVSDLLNRGASIDGQDRFGYTPLMLAVKRDCTAVAKYLVDQGANLEVRSIHHFTPLMLACYLGNTGMIKLLLKSGANILAIDHRRMMSIHLAAHMGHTKAVQILGKEIQSAGYIVDICAPHDMDIAHIELQSNKYGQSYQVQKKQFFESKDRRENVVYSSTGIKEKDRKSNSIGFIDFRGRRNSGAFSFIKKLKHSTSKVNQAVYTGMERITSIFGRGRRSGDNFGRVRAQFLTGSLSRAVHSKRNLFGAYDKDLSDSGDHNKFSPHELLQDHSMASIVETVLKRGAVDGLSPLALAVKAGHLEVVQCLVKMGADPTAYDSTDFSPYERALIISGEEEERIAADEASSEQSRILSKFIKLLKGMCSCYNCFFGQTNKSKENKKHERGSTSVLDEARNQKHREETAKSRAKLAGKVVEALNESQSVVQERCLLGCRNWLKELFVAIILVGLLISFSPVASDHPQRHERITPLRNVVINSITSAVGTGTNGADAIKKWWLWHEKTFFNENADFVSSGPSNASSAIVKNSKDYSFVGGILLMQQRYAVGENVVDCGMNNLKACHTDPGNAYQWTRPNLEKMENALDESINKWDVTYSNIENIQVKSYSSDDIVVPPYVALSLVNRPQSLQTLSQMKNISWANDGTRFLFTKFSIFHQTKDDAYYCHVDVRIDFPVTGGTSISVDVQEFTSPMLHWSIHRFAPSAFLWVFVGTISVYHLSILVYSYITVGWLRCVRSTRTWIEVSMMGLMISVGIMNSSALDTFYRILQNPLGSTNKYHALYKVANLVKVTNDAYSLAFTLISLWNILKVFPQAPIIGPKISAIINTIMAINQLVYLIFTFLICLVFSFRWNISLFGVESLFTTQGLHTKDSYVFALFRVPFADEFGNAMDSEQPRRELNIYMEMIFFVCILIITQNYIGVFVENYDRENKRAEAQWNEHLDNELRRKGMIKYNSNVSEREKNELTHKRLKKYLDPALLLIGDDGLVFSGDGKSDHVHGAADREHRINNAMRGTSTSLSSINSSIDSMRNSIPEFKRDIMQALQSARKILAKAHTRKMASKVHRFINRSSSVNTGVLGLARAPPQGRAPPKPQLNKQIKIMQENAPNGEEKAKARNRLIQEERNKNNHTPEPPPRPPKL
jgi:ankyrin repeat protein/nicotinamidase-related amidase